MCTKCIIETFRECSLWLMVMLAQCAQNTSISHQNVILHLVIVSLSQHFRSEINGKLNYLQ